MYKLILADGIEIENLELNGNNFIPQEEINKDIFKNNLGNVSIIDGNGNVEEYEDMKVVFAKIGKTETFVLLEKTQADKDREALLQLTADLDYLAIMTEVDLDV